MDLFSKLTAYDLMGCIPPGFVLLAGIDYLFGTQLILDGDWDVAKGTLVLFMAYIGGHVVATPSSAILEKTAIHRWLKEPLRHMLWGTGIKWWHRLISADYFRPLAPSSRNMIKSKLPTGMQEITDDDGTFWYIYSIAKRDVHAQLRLSNFLSLYGFCRNISFACLLIFIATSAKITLAYFEIFSTQTKETDVLIVIGSALAAYMMFQRYMKFYRSYTGELLSTFSQISPTPPA